MTPLRPDWKFVVLAKTMILKDYNKISLNRAQIFSLTYQANKTNMY